MANTGAKVSIGIDVPIWVWMSDIVNMGAFVICFGSLITSLWLLFLSVHIHWSAPIIFGLFTVIAEINMRPYAATKQAVTGLVKDATTIEDEDKN